MTDASIEEQLLTEALAAEGVPLCSACGIRPVRGRKVPTGRAPTTCNVCAAKKGRPGVKEKPPVSVKVQFPAARAGKGDKDFALVQAKAKQWAMFTAVGLQMVGQESDARAIDAAKDSWATAVAGLAPYEPWLVKLCQGGEASGRAMAWVGVGMATLGMMAPVLINHGMIPEGPLRTMAAAVSAQAAEALADAAAEESAAA